MLWRWPWLSSVPNASRRLLLLLILACAAVFAAVPARAATVADEVQTSWRLLDYIAVDYREAVRGGRIVNQLEYDEMVEFSSNVAAKLRGAACQSGPGGVDRRSRPPTDGDRRQGAP